MNAPPPRGEVVAQFVHEDEHAQHEKEGAAVADDVGNCWHSLSYPSDAARRRLVTPAIRHPILSRSFRGGDALCGTPCRGVKLDDGVKRVGGRAAEPV
ncbi:MAG: hypothetical protein NVSMB18_36800 [Acetobacteraceae bacterium]